MTSPDGTPASSTESKPIQESLTLADPASNPERGIEAGNLNPATPSDPSLKALERPNRRQFLWLAVTFAAGLGSGYLLRGWPPALQSGAVPEGQPDTGAETTIAAAGDPVSLPAEYALPVSYGDLGPQLLRAGAIDRDQFVQVYREAGRPLSPEQLAILTSGSDEQIVITPENAYFLLNLFWAAGLANRNPLLTEGQMMQYGGSEQIGRFASTGGWTIGTKPAPELYASTSLFDLTPAQQTRLEAVAGAVYRPCCDNPTSFPDCNHGMAMLGVLELLAAHDVTAAEMFEAAKYLNAFWFPQQTLELALLFNHRQDQPFAAVDGRQLVSASFFSGSGFRAVHQWLADNNLLPQTPGGGNSCGV